MNLNGLASCPASELAGRGLFEDLQEDQHNWPYQFHKSVKTATTGRFITTYLTNSQNINACHSKSLDSRGIACKNELLKIVLKGQEEAIIKVFEPGHGQWSPPPQR